MTHKTEVELIIPKIEDLCCINCKVEAADMQDPIIKSVFHAKVLTCRLIIYTVRCCIASPSIQDVANVIHVIVSRQFYDTGKLQQHLKDLNVKFDEPEPVYTKIYEACLKYTFTFKIAPRWNLVDQSYYLRGFNFLSLPSHIDALEWNIVFKDGVTKLEIIPLKINLYPFTIEFLNLESEILEDFMGNSYSVNTINLPAFQSPWIYVLPKLTRARLVSVSKTLPESCPFNNYDDLRRHWKNMYSYRLPKSQHGMLFYEVVFPINPHQLFIYPEMCILSKKPEIFPCDNKSEIASEFIKDLSTNVRSVCGETIKIGHLFPELNVEYSYVLKKKTNSCEINSVEKNVGELTSSYFASSSNCNMKPMEKKIKFPKSLTVEGIDDMTPTMKNHTQKVLSIMNNQKGKKNKKSEKDRIMAQMATNNDEVEKVGLGCYNKKADVHISPERYFRTKVDNIDNIISYYDIPSMRSPSDSYDSDEFLRSINEEDFINALIEDMNDDNDETPPDTKRFSPQTNFEEPTCENQQANKPIIKNIENVHYDLKNLRKISPGNKTQKGQEEKSSASLHQLDKPGKESSQNRDIQNLCDKENYETSPTLLNGRIANEDVLQNSNSKHTSSSRKNYSHNKQNFCDQIRFPVSDSRLNTELEAEKSSKIFKSKKNKFQNNDEESFNDFRSLLYQCHSQNIYQKEDRNFEESLGERYSKSFSIDSVKKLQDQLVKERSFNHHSELIRNSEKNVSQETKIQQPIQKNSSPQNSPINKPKRQKTEIRLQQNESKLNHSFQNTTDCSKDKKNFHKSSSTKSMMNLTHEELLQKRDDFLKYYTSEECEGKFNHPQGMSVNKFQPIYGSQEDKTYTCNKEALSLNGDSRYDSKEKVSRKLEKNSDYQNFNKHNNDNAEKSFLADSPSWAPTIDTFAGSVNRRLLQPRSPASTFNSRNNLNTVHKFDEKSFFNTSKFSSISNKCERSNEVLLETANHLNASFTKYRSNENSKNNSRTPSPISEYHSYKKLGVQSEINLKYSPDPFDNSDKELDETQLKNNSEDSPDLFDFCDKELEKTQLKNNSEDLPDFFSILENKQDIQQLKNNPQCSPVILKSEDKILENIQQSENEEESDIFGSYNEMQTRTLFRKYESDFENYSCKDEKSELNEDHSQKQTDDGDFMSLLSDSSDEMNTENYENYKQACIEASTFES